MPHEFRTSVPSSQGLDQALAGIGVDIPGAGATPDGSGTAAPAGTPAGQPVREGDGNPTPPGAAPPAPPAGEPATPQTEGEPPQGDQGAGEAAAIEQMRQAAQPQEGDSSTIKALRDLLKTRVDAYDAGQAATQQPSATPQLSNEDQQRLALINDLYAFDPQAMKPTTQGFISKLAGQNVELVNQLLLDAINVPKPGSEIQGWTLGHELLLRMGLDPMKFNDLVRFSRGEISGDAYGIYQVPDYIPEEYHEAYKQLNPVLRADVDIYLKGDKEEQRAAALQLLQDKQGRINDKLTLEQQTARNVSTLNADIAREVDTQLTTTYSGLLDSVSANPMFKDVRVSGDEKTDQMVKTTIINGICAMGDDNAVLASRAMNAFEEAGVKIDRAKVGQLLKEIRTDTEIAIKAERMGRATGRDYSIQAREALSRRDSNVGRAISLANSYASEMLRKFAPLPAAQGDQPHDNGAPALRGGAPGTGGNGAPPPQGGGQGAPGIGKPMSPAELDAFILGTANTIKEGAGA